MPSLTPHFHSEEFDCHDGTPVPHHAYADLRRLCRRYLERLRERHGPVFVVSGYRTLSHNRQVGGAPHSYHVYRVDREGVAADVRCRDGSPADWGRTLEALGAPGLGIYGSHVHVDNRQGRARW